MEFLAPFDYDIVPAPRTQNTIADALSRDERYLAHIVDMGGELVSNVRISPELFACITSICAEFSGGNDLENIMDLTFIIPQSVDTSAKEVDECLDAVRKEYTHDPRAIQSMKNQRKSSESAPRIKPNDYVVLNGYVYFSTRQGVIYSTFRRKHGCRFFLQRANHIRWDM